MSIADDIINGKYKNNQIMKKKKKKEEEEVEVTRSVADDIINGTYERNQLIPKRETIIDDDIAPVGGVIKPEDRIEVKSPFIEEDTLGDKIRNSVTGVAGNFLMGIEGTIPKATSFITESKDYISKKASGFVAEKILGIVAPEMSDEERGAVSSVLGAVATEQSKKITGNTAFSSLDKVLNSEVMEEWRKETIQENTEKANKGGTVGSWANDLALGVGQNVIPTAIAFVPGGQVVSAGLFMSSAGGSYLEDAEQKGMNEDEKMAYASTMAVWEGGFDWLSTGFVTKAFKLAGAGEFLSKESLKNTLFGASLNAVQEGLTEPAQEGVADLVGDYGDWENMPERMARSASIGFVSALIFDGAGKGIGSATYAMNVHNNTKQAIATAEQQLGRSLSAEETTQIQEQIKAQIKAQMVDTTDLSEKERAEIERISNMSYEDMLVTVAEDVAKSGKVDVNEVMKGVNEALDNQTLAPVQTENSEVIKALREQQIAEKEAELEATEDRREREIIQDELDILQEELAPVQEATEPTDPKQKSFAYETNENDSEYKKAVYESANEVMNDTEETHKFVDAVAKISEEKQTTYKFVNNAQLKEQGYNVKEGTTINGLVNENGEVLINVDSKKYLNVVLGHETTHLLEGTKEYEDLKAIAVKYAETTGEYQNRLDTLNKLYEGKNADIEAELTADIVGDYLFTNEQFVQELSVEKPTLFQKIKNLISDLVVKFKGTEQEKQLRELQRKFEKAYQADNTQKSENVKYSVSEINNISDIKDKYKDQTQYLILSESENSISINNMVVKKELRNQGIGQKILNDIIEYANKNNKTITLTPTTEFNTQNRLKKWYKANGFVENKGKNTDFLISDTMYKLPTANSNVKYSISDNQGRTLSKEQQEYFKDSKVRDEEGNLLTVYHGTEANVDIPKEHWFSVFDINRAGDHGSMLGEGFYFTTDRTHAQENYAHSRGNVYETYLNITNPLELNHFSTGDLAYQIRQINPYIEADIYKRNGEIDAYKVRRYLIENGYDGIHSGNTYVAFYSEQIKNVDNTKPTTNPDIRYSLSSDTDSEGNKIPEAMQRYMKNTKVVDENGNLKRVYHGTPSGKFNIFDRSYGNAEGDFGKGFYFTDNSADVEANYEGGGPDFENKVSRLAEQIEQDEEISYDEAKEKAREQLYKEAYKFTTYLNIENPAVVGETLLFDPENYADDINAELEAEAENYIDEIEERARENYGLEDTDTIEDYMLEEARNEILDEYGIKQEIEQKYIEDDVENAIDSVVNIYDVDAEQLRQIIWDTIYEGGLEVQAFKDKINAEIEIYDEEYNFANNEAVRMIIESLGYDGIIDNTVSEKFSNMGMEEGTTHYIVFNSNQIKDIYNENPTTNPDINLSLSNENEEVAPIGDYQVRGEDVKLQIQEAIAPLQETIEALTEKIETIAPVQDAKVAENASYKKQDAPVSLDIVEAQNAEAFDNITDNDAPVEATSFEDSLDDIFDEVGTTKETVVESPFDNRDIDEVGNRKVKAYQYENPEVRPYFQAEAEMMLYDLDNTIKGEKIAIKDEEGYITDWAGISRQTTEAIAYLKDKYGYSYDQIRTGLNKIIQDDGAENNAVSKRIEFMLDERLREGYTTSDGIPIPANEDYIKFLEEKQIMEYNKEAFEAITDDDAPIEDIAPSVTNENVPKIENELKVDDNLAPTQKDAVDEFLELVDSLEEAEKVEEGKIAQVLTERPTAKNKDQRLIMKARASFLDKGSVIEDISLKTKNRELMAKWDNLMLAQAKAQHTIGNGVQRSNKATKQIEQVSGSLDSTREKVVNSGKTQEFSDYMYHFLNIDRMSLEANAQAKMTELQETVLKGYDLEKIETLSRKRVPSNVDKKSKSEQLALDLQIKENLIKSAKEYMALLEVKNKPVFGESVTAEQSKQIVEELEFNNPEFADWANEIYEYNRALRDILVENGVISQETSDYFETIYPHYVPIQRVDKNGKAINVPLDTNRTGVNTPIKRATGGNSDIMPLFDTLANRTFQTYRASSRNSFGLELKKALNVSSIEETASVESVMDSVDDQESLLQEGRNGLAPTFTVFEDGKKVTYEISQDIYDALKPVSDSSLLSTTVRPLNLASNYMRGVLTQYNPLFSLTNAMKDAQDILINSQHPGKTYAKFGEAYAQILKKGYWYKEYMANGGEQNSYFDSQDGFDHKPKGVERITEFLPLRAISAVNDVVETAPRLAEYIASRESGRSIEVSMLDASRVTTNFKAGGDVTKWANRNGFTFLNASIQGLNQNIRNVREAHSKGLKGYLNLATKFAIAGAPALILNGLLWGDDEEYEELSDYVKQNYYVVGKLEDGTFIRIPKGRMSAVLQEGANQMMNLVTGNDEADLGTFLELVANNLAPNNPIENNVFAPISQAISNTTWYGEDLVPTRLQDEPVEQQYDESTDKFSIWLGQQIGASPYKINYLLDQYSGGIGDVLLPMGTPQAEGRTEDDLASNAIAPFVNKFSTNSTLNNQNVSDFYSTSEELTSNANSVEATDEDVLKNKYFNSIKGDMNELYKQKRELQADETLSDTDKYDKVLEVQEQINSLAKTALSSYENISKSDTYAQIGDREYYKYTNKDGEEEWKKVEKDELAEIDDLGMDLNDKTTYFRTKNKINKIVNLEKEVKSSEEKRREVATLVRATSLTDEQKAYLYGKSYSSDETLNMVIKSEIPFNEYLDYASQTFEADKDSNGKTVSGSKKKKVIEYVNTLNLNIPQKAIIIRKSYTSFREYNNEIVSYVNELNLSIAEKRSILEELDFTVKDDGTVSWK